MNAPIQQSVTLGHSREQVQSLIQTGKYFYDRGWSLGTSSNYSVVLSHDPLRLLITGSGKHKGRLTEQDFVIVDEAGKTLEPVGVKASAETLLHVVAAKADPQKTGLAYTGTSNARVGAVLHTHSVWAAILSDYYFPLKHVPIQGIEMVKGLAGVSTHENLYKLPIFENSQDIPLLARHVAVGHLDKDNPVTHGYLIRGHGLYTWGKDLTEARRHVEVIEYLLEVIGRKLSLPKLDI